MLLIIVTGAPAAGKTTVGRRIAEAFCLPFISKDGIKETLFDSLGWKDREWSKKLGAASMELLFHLVEVLLQAGRPCVVEANFYPEFHTSRFLVLKQEFGFEPFQVVCRANTEVLAERYKQRAISGERHSGHVDRVLVEEFDFETLPDRFHALEIGGQVVQVDTTHFEAIDYEDLFQAIAYAREKLS